METKKLSDKALGVIESYLHFKMGSATTSVPYFNNKVSRSRMALRALVGKGTAKDIREEVETLLVKSHIPVSGLDGDSLKKILVDHNLGIDCSGLAYYVLDVESKHQGQGHLNRHLSFMSKGPLSKMRSYLRPAENCHVKTLASDSNSHIIPLAEIKPADFIAMQGTIENAQRDHIILITEVRYENGIAKSFNYTHAVAYPEDGLYGTGIRRGMIEIKYPDQSLFNQIWSEEGDHEKARRIFERASASKTEIRRLKWLT